MAMSSFQKRADKLLREHGWTFTRFSSKGYSMYRRGDETTTVSCSPKNESDSLKQVCKFAGIKQ